MDADRAKAIAIAAHRDVRSLDAEPLLRHVERTAACVPDWARTVAWLHEVLERTGISEETLLRRGLTGEELRALRLLSREESCSDRAYMGHIELIARAGGTAGRLARAVKIADLEDRKAHPLVRSNGWSPPYATALNALHRRIRMPSRGAA